MAGTNNVKKYLETNRDGQVSYASFYGAKGENFGGAYFSGVGGAISADNLINGGVVFEAGASGVFTMPSLATMKTAMELNFPTEDGYCIQTKVVNHSGGPITLDFTGSGITPCDGIMTVVIPDCTVFEAEICQQVGVGGALSYIWTPIGFSTNNPIPITQQIAYDNSIAAADSPMIDLDITYPLTYRSVHALFDFFQYLQGAWDGYTLSKNTAGPTVPTSKQVAPFTDTSLVLNLFHGTPTAKTTAFGNNWGSRSLCMNYAPAGNQSRGSLYLSRVMETEAGAQTTNSSWGMVNLSGTSTAFDLATNRGQNCTDGIFAKNMRFEFFGHYDNYSATNRLYEDIPGVFDGGVGQLLPRLGPTWYSVDALGSAGQNWGSAASQVRYTLGTFRIINPAGAVGTTVGTPFNVLAGLSNSLIGGTRMVHTLKLSIQAQQLGNNADTLNPNAVGSGNVWHGDFKLTWTPAGNFVITQIQQHTTTTSGNLFSVAGSVTGNITITNPANAALLNENGRVVAYYIVIINETNFTKL